MDDKRKSDMMLKPIFQQLESMQMIINEIRSEQKLIATDLINTKQETQELGQRQMERTLPMLETVTKKLFGNGTTGLLDDHIACQEKIKNIEAQLDGLSGLTVWVRNLVIALAGSAVTAIALFAVMLFQVRELWRIVIK